MSFTRGPIYSLQPFLYVISGEIEWIGTVRVVPFGISSLIKNKIEDN